MTLTILIFLSIRKLEPLLADQVTHLMFYTWCGSSCSIFYLGKLRKQSWLAIKTGEKMLLGICFLGNLTRVFWPLSKKLAARALVFSRALKAM